MGVPFWGVPLRRFVSIWDVTGLPLIWGNTQCTAIFWGESLAQGSLLPDVTLCSVVFGFSSRYTTRSLVDFEIIRGVGFANVFGCSCRGNHPIP